MTSESLERRPRAPRAFGRRAHAAYVALALALATAGLVGCPGSLSDPAAFEDGGTTVDSGPAATCTPANIASTLFTPTCATTSCHSSSALAGDLDLQSPNLYARLVGKPDLAMVGVLIDPAGNPSNSVIYEVLGSNPPGGSRMPLSGVTLSSAQIACVASWIKAGASDASSVSEAGAPDASTPDASTPDTSAPDTSAPVDAPVEDTSPPDTGAKDAAGNDSASPDASAKDAGPVDASDHDGGSTDAGTSHG